MKILHYKTNIRCEGCKARIKPFLDEERDIVSWSVDLHHPDRILRIEGDGMSEDLVPSLLKKAGYEANLLT